MGNFKIHNGTPESISSCADTVFTFDSNQRELTQHGTEEFPCAFYLDKYKNSSFPWHWHDEIELAYVQKGEVTAFINEQRYILCEGDGIFINSGVLHSFSGQAEVESLFPNVLFHASLIYGTQKSVFWLKYVSPVLEAAKLSHVLLHGHTPWQKAALGFIREVYNLLNSKEWGYEFKVRNGLSEFMCLLCEHCSEMLSETSSKNSLEVNRIRQMLDFIQYHYTEPIQLQQIAAAASISKRECLRCFNNIIGVSPKQYIIDLRIQKAKTLLRESSLSLSEICENCGFQSQSYFTKVFREIMGSSPGKYRNENYKGSLGKEVITNG